MPTIGGVNIGWDEGKPQGSDSLGIGDDQIRSDKTALRSAIGAEHIFESTGGANSGAHVLGSARPYVGTQSLVSSSGSDGRLMWASDTSNFFHVGSGGTALIGGPRVLSMGSYPGTVPQRHYWAIEVGIAKTGAAGTVAINYSAFSGQPFVTATALDILDTAAKTVNLTGTVNTTQATFHSYSGSVSTSNVTFHWMSIGSRAF